MKYNLEEVYVGSVFRLVFFIVLILFGFFGLIFLVYSIFISMLLWGILIFVIGVPFYALLCAVMAAIYTAIYNVFARKFGGISIELKKEEF